jgi:lysozyme
MNRPKITKAELLELMKAEGFTPPLEAVYVVGIRGYYKKSMGNPAENDRGIYDDAMVVIAPGEFRTYNANTDPSKYKKGIARLIKGWHRFRKGLHGFGRKVPAYPAFRTANHTETLPVTRDGQTGIHEGKYINIHSGGDVYTNSAGCQTVMKSQWREFQTSVYKLMDQEGQKELPYLLIEN